MKRFLAMILIVVPVMLGAQNKSSFEFGGGVSFMDKMTKDGDGGGHNAMILYGEYRYNVRKGLSLAAQYQLIPNWSDTLIGVDEDGYNMLASKGATQALNILAEYNPFSGSVVSPFFGVGAGPQYDFAKLSDGHSWNKWGFDLHCRAGLELFRHLRLTFGHHHYCSHIFRAAQPAYYVSAGWVF